MADYDNYNDYGDSGTPTSIGSALNNQIDVGSDGHLKIFGKEFDVGPQLATILRPLVTTALNEVSLRGASTATRWGTATAKFVHMPEQWAAKTGKGIGFVWLFGLSGADVALGIKKTVSDGYKDMHELRDKWQPLLAANNNMDVGVGKALTCNYGVFTHARAKVYENGKRNVLATIAGGIRAVPNIVMGLYQHQLNNIQNPNQALEAQFSPRIMKMHRSGEMPVNAEDKVLLEKLKTEQKRLNHQNNIQTPDEIVASQFPPHIVEMRYSDEKPTKGQDEQLFKEMNEMYEDLTSKRPQNVRNTQQSTLPDRDPNDVAMKMLDWSKDPDFYRRMRHPKNANEYLQNIRELKYTPALVDLGASGIEHLIAKKNDNSTEDAGDKILGLQAYIHNHDQPDHENVVTAVREIFQQRAKDMGRKYEIEGDTFDRVTEAVADAVVYGLHPQALAELLDNKKVVSFGAKEADFGELEDVKTALGALKEKYTPKVSEKQFYKNAPFTKDSLVKTFKEIPEEEKPFFVMLFPAGILEKAGVDKAVVAKYREDGKKSFVDELTGMTKYLMETSREELKKQGIKNKVIDEFEAFKEAFRRAESNDRGNDFIEKGTSKATRVVRDVALSAKSPQELWQNYLKKRGAEAAERIPAAERKGTDHLANEDGIGDEAGIPTR